MRAAALFVCGLLFVLAMRAPASAECCAACELASRVCNEIKQACVELKYAPSCDVPQHECVTPYIPCEPLICPPRACHKPLVTCYPCGPVCPPEACHLPVVTAYPLDCWDVEPVLTGSEDLIAPVEACCCACSDCSAG